MKLKETFAAKVAEAKAAFEAGNVEQGKALKAEAATLKEALTGLDEIEAMKASVIGTVLRPPLPGDPPAPKDAAENTGAKSFDAVYVLRYGDEDVPMKTIYSDLVGHDYRQLIFDQGLAYEKYLRFGEVGLEADERRLLRRQIFPVSQIKSMVKAGFDVDLIKTTMVEAQGVLGGYAVPPNSQENIISRLPGRTAVRGAGARVVLLVNGNSIEMPRYSGGDDRYRGGLRGMWGTETSTANEDNGTMELVTVVANLYTYKVIQSQSLVEDAANLVDLLTEDMVDTLAIDEDNEFLVGNGVGKPLGILPGSANALSLTEVVSLNASALTADGIKKLKRGVASQYRSSPRAAWVGNSDTFGAIEILESSTGSGYVFPDLSEDDMLLKKRVFESEAMPDVAANAYPLIFGDMSGYHIVERAGLTIARFQDSNTGINKVEFHVRRRVGGRVGEPWKFAVQKVAAS